MTSLEAPRRAGPGTAGRLLVIGCGLVLLGAALRVAIHDPSELPVSGDQASFTYQALSLLGGDLAYDASDQERWVDLGWDDQPHGLFVQRRDDGWAFAKPLGYSVLLAPSIAVAGVRGISLVGAGLVLAYAACWYELGRLRWDRATAAAVATAATVASHAWLFGFPAHADLFVAVLVGLAALGGARVALRAPGTHAVGWLSLSAVATALLVTEKLPALVALAPLLVLAVARAPGRARVVATVAGAVVVAASVAPYLFYSDGESWSAYGGDRYYALGTTPWSGGTDADLTPWQTRDSFSPGFVLDSITDPDGDVPAAALTYAVGRHTGVATFQPVVAALAVATAAAVWRRRRGAARAHAPTEAPGAVVPLQAADRRAGEAETAGRTTDEARAVDRPVALAAAAGLAAYVGLYLVAFTDNYFGGGQSIGNRYFLQVSVLAVVVAVAGGVASAAARWCGGVAACVAVVVLGAHLKQPEEAFYRIERTTAVQRRLPFDSTQVHSWRFRCEPATCVPPPLESYGEG